MVCYDMVTGMFEHDNEENKSVDTKIRIHTEFIGIQHSYGLKKMMYNYDYT